MRTRLAAPAPARGVQARAAARVGELHREARRAHRLAQHAVRRGVAERRAAQAHARLELGRVAVLRAEAEHEQRGVERVAAASGSRGGAGAPAAAAAARASPAALIVDPAVAVAARTRGLERCNGESCCHVASSNVDDERTFGAAQHHRRRGTVQRNTKLDTDVH